MKKFVIDDEMHSEWMGEFSTLKETIEKLQELAIIPWDEDPNRAPCVGWKTCGRDYYIIEYDDSTLPWTEINNKHIMRMDSLGATWHKTAEEIHQIFDR